VSPAASIPSNVLHGQSPASDNRLAAENRRIRGDPRQQRLLVHGRGLFKCKSDGYPTLLATRLEIPLDFLLAILDR
jgi:glycerol-3-phosphate O-acyltransferase